MKREKTAEAVAKAAVAWSAAPIHIKAMAGAYVAPLLEALEAMNSELQSLDDDLIAGVK